MTILLREFKTSDEEMKKIVLKVVKQCVATEEVAKKVGSSEIVTRIVEDLKDESEPYRKMVMETIEKVIADLSAADIDQRLEEQLIDGILYSFQEQTSEDTAVMLN